MTYTYDYIEATRVGTVLLDGAPAFSFDEAINPSLHGHLDKWHRDGKLNTPDVLIDVATKRVRITSIAFDETVKDESNRDEVQTLLSEFVQDAVDNGGFTPARARWLVRFLWRFFRRTQALTGRL